MGRIALLDVWRDEDGPRDEEEPEDELEEQARQPEHYA